MRALGRAWFVDRRQIAITAFAALLFLAWAALALHNASIQNGKVLGDWVINYSQGFVRRGLIGSVLGRLAGVSGVDVTKWVAALQISLYASALFFWLRVLAGRCKPFWYLLLVFSPATLLFSYFGSAELGRKEVLHFALLAFFVWSLSSHRLNLGLAALMALMSGLATLSHELVLFYTPYFLMAAATTSTAQRGLALKTAGAIVLTSAGAAACVFFWAHPMNGRAMCDALMQAGYSASICKGIILWPMEGALANAEESIKAIKYFNYLSFYPLAFVLTLAPVLLWMRRYESASVRRQVIWFAVAALVSLPSFVLAMDWGRFIQVHLVSAMIVLSLQLKRLPMHGQDQAVKRSLLTASPLINWPHPWLACAVAVGCLSLSLFWNMPTCCVSDLGTGVVGKLHDAAGHAISLPWR